MFYKMMIQTLAKIFIAICAVFVIGFLFGAKSFATENKTSEANTTVMKQEPIVVGILMPMDHMALREIVGGFKETLMSLSKRPVEFKVQNAQGDMNVQRSIIQQFVNQKVDLIVPIGTAATQMTVKLAEQQPIVSLAAVHKANEGQNQTPMMTGVLDEIGPEKPLALLAQVIPKLKKITLVHSNSEKIFPELSALINYAAAHNLEVQKLMIQSLPDMYTISGLIAEDSEAIFVLKDHLVVSGIKTLVREAKKKNIPVMAMDEGSVKEGASFALAVKERAIGEEGAVLANQVLSGTAPGNLPLKILDKLSVFYNERACLEQGINVEDLKTVTLKFGYEISASE